MLSSLLLFIMKNKLFQWFMWIAQWPWIKIRYWFLGDRTPVGNSPTTFVWYYMSYRCIGDMSCRLIILYLRGEISERLGTYKSVKRLTYQSGRWNRNYHNPYSRVYAIVCICSWFYGIFLQKNLFHFCQWTKYLLCSLFALP